MQRLPVPSNREIAIQLRITEATVKNYVSSIFS